MQILTITAADLDENNRYIGKEDVTDYDGHIEIADGLGYVRFDTYLKATGHIFASSGSGIRAGWDIEAGEDIKAGRSVTARYGIKAGWDIEAGEDIKAGYGIKAGHGIAAGDGIKAGYGVTARYGIKAGWGITAGKGIKAGHGIAAGDGIKAGWGIKAGYGIKAGWGITAGKGINAKTIFARLRIFAGLIAHRLPEAHELEIRAKLLGGTIAHGTLVEPKRDHAEIIRDLRSISPEAARFFDELEGDD